MSAQQEVITASEVRQAEGERRSLITKFAERYGLEPNKMMATLKATAFKGDVTNEQMAALLIVADQHKLNPWCKEIYAFPSRQGIVPVVGVDGWARIINEHPQFDGMDFEQNDESCTCKMYRKDRSHPTVVTEYLAECKRPTDPWNTHPKRMLRHKAMIQAARLAFAFAGIYDPDEADRVLAAEDAIDVTPAKPTLALNDEGKPEFRNADGSVHVPPKKVSPKKLKEAVEGARAAVVAKDAAGLYKIRSEFDNEQWLFIWGELRSYERTDITNLQATPAYEIAESGLDLAAWCLTTIEACKAPEQLQAAYKAVEEVYADHDQEVPGDIETVYQDRKRELGIQS